MRKVEGGGERGLGGSKKVCKFRKREDILRKSGETAGGGGESSISVIYTQVKGVNFNTFCTTSSGAMSTTPTSLAMYM